MKWTTKDTLVSDTGHVVIEVDKEGNGRVFRYDIAAGCLSAEDQRMHADPQECLMEMAKLRPGEVECIEYTKAAVDPVIAQSGDKLWSNEDLLNGHPRCLSLMGVRYVQVTPELLMLAHRMAQLARTNGSLPVQELIHMAEGENESWHGHLQRLLKQTAPERKEPANDESEL